MNICQDAGGISGTVTVTTPDSEAIQPVSKPGMGQITMTYTCSGRSMTTKIAFPGLPSMARSPKTP